MNATQQTHNGTENLTNYVRFVEQQLGHKEKAYVDVVSDDEDLAGRIAHKLLDTFGEDRVEVLYGTKWLVKGARVYR